MTNVVAIAEGISTFRQVEEKLGVRLAEDRQFFLEWMDVGHGLSEIEQARLDQVRRNYLYQCSDGILLEETIKMVILSPLLELAGFYQAPYKFRAEVAVEMQALGENDEVLRGRIDALVLQEQLWIVLIESKRTTFDLELALPQALTYMAATPGDRLPLYGLVTNGSSYLFVKMQDKQYAISDLFSTRSSHRNNLHEVLQILKQLGHILTQDA
jgi:predicted type IV restriction endonuclease